jgi:hypothetical protein
MFIVLVINAKYSWITCFLIAVLVAGLFKGAFFSDFTYENVPQSKTA